MGTAAETKPIGKKGIAKAADFDSENKLDKLGWKVETLTSGIWAYEKHGDRRIGPATTIAALETMVNIQLGQGPEVRAKNGNGKADTNGNGTGKTVRVQTEEQRLPTMEEPEIDELNRQADNCIDLKAERDAAKTAFDDACDVMRQKMREFDRKRYNRRGFSLVIEDTEKLVVKKAENVKGPKNPSTKKGSLI